MQTTLGDEDAFSAGTINDVLERAREHASQDVRDELKRTQAVVADTEAKLQDTEEEFSQARRAQIAKLETISTTVASVVVNGLFWVLLIAVAFVVFVSLPLPTPFPNLWPEKATGFLVAVLFLTALIFAVLTLANLGWGTTLRSWLRGREVRLTQWIRSRLASMFLVSLPEHDA